VGEGRGSAATPAGVWAVGEGRGPTAALTRAGPAPTCAGPAPTCAGAVRTIAVGRAHPGATCLHSTSRLHPTGCLHPTGRLHATGRLLAAGATGVGASGSALIRADRDDRAARLTRRGGLRAASPAHPAVVRATHHRHHRADVDPARPDTERAAGPQRATGPAGQRYTGDGLPDADHRGCA